MKKRRKRELPPSLSSRSPAPTFLQSTVSPPISPTQASSVLSVPHPEAGQMIMSGGTGQMSMSSDDQMMLHRMDLLEYQIRILRQQGILSNSPEQTSFPHQYTGWA
mmetsp:Transcript_99287/g.182132  ORF Transcript_99287/g.182132 Transcript_99287/m.182132 type:complete len:106 (+) Transcript_99287:3-320(+)